MIMTSAPAYKTAVLITTVKSFCKKGPKKVKEVVENKLFIEI